MKIKLLLFACVLILMTSCEKRESVCEYYNNGQLKLINRGENAGECYYLQNGKPVFLEKKDCAWYCN